MLPNTCSRHGGAPEATGDCLLIKTTSVVASEIAGVPMAALMRGCTELGLRCSANATKLQIANIMRNHAKDVVSKNTNASCVSAIADFKSDIGFFSRFLLDVSSGTDVLAVPWNKTPVKCSELLAVLDVMTTEELREALRSLNVKVARNKRKSRLTYLLLDHFETVLETYVDLTEDSLRDWLATYLGHQPPLDFTPSDLLMAILDMTIPETALSALMSCPRSSVAGTTRAVHSIQDMQRARLRGLRRRIHDGAVAHFWPHRIPGFVRLACMSDFHDASNFKPAKCCASCARCRIDIPVKEITFSKGKSDGGWTLESLRCDDEWLLSHPEKPFQYQDGYLDGLMLERAGIPECSPGRSIVNFCAECETSVRRGKIPRLSYRNGLFRGRLPEFLQDLSWVEEQVLALYRIGTNVSRMYGSSNPELPFVLYGNTCAHPQNVVETAAVLPRTASDVTDAIGVIFVGPGKYKPKGLQTFRVRRAKLIAFGRWLRRCNKLYAAAPWDDARFDQYPEDGCLPGIESRVVHREVDDPSAEFARETAGLDPHPAMAPHRLEEDEEFVFMDAMGITDSTADTIQARTFEATALLNILPVSMRVPDVTIHRGSAAIPEYGNCNLFPGLYPTLFPYGIGGLEDWDAQAEKQRVGFRAHAAYLLDQVDRRFSGHPSFMFVVINILQRRAVHLETRFRIKSSRIESIAPSLQSVTPEQIRRVAKHIQNHGSYTNIAAEDRKVLELLNLVEMITAKVPGSHSSKLNLRRKIFAMCRHFSVPQVYLTLNTNPLQSPLFQLMAGDVEVDLSLRYPKVASAIKRSLRIANDPAMAAHFFDLSMRLVFEHLFGWDFALGRSKKRGGILGHLEAFAISNELTNRGVFHLHAVLWLKGGLNPREVRERIQEDEEFERRFFAFWDEAIRHHLPDLDVVEQSTNPKQERPPCPPIWVKTYENTKDHEAADKMQAHETAELAQWKDEFEHDVKRVGEAVQRHTHKEVCTKYEFKGLCRFQFPHEVVGESHYDPSENAIVLRCLDPMVNYFNPEILVMCRHNHDIKCILSGRAAQAAIFYITNYITKLDVNTHQVLNTMSDAINLLKERPLEPGQTVDLRTMLHKCLSRIIKTQQMHAQRAAALIRGSGDCFVSHTTVPMISGQLMKYTIGLYLTETDVIVGCAHGNEDESDETSEEPTDAMDANVVPDDIVPEDIEIADIDPALEVAMDESGQISFGNQFDDYFYRPECLDEVNFYDFAQRYRTVPLRTRGQGSSSGLKLEPGHPRAKSHMLQPREREKGGEDAQEFVPMSIGPSIPRKGDNKYYKLYCLSHFKPFSCRTPLLGPGEQLESMYETFSFDPRARRRMDNWEALHECGDERDAERLRKQSTRTAEEIVMEHGEDGDDDAAYTAHHSALLNDNFQKATYGAWSALDSAGWFGDVQEQEEGLGSNTFAYPEAKTKAQVARLMKVWQAETKVQEAQRRLEAAGRIEVQPRTTTADALEAPDRGPTTVLSGEPRRRPLTEGLITEVADKYELNAEQNRAFNVCTTWLRQYFEAESGTISEKPKPLSMILHGPGGTGKTHSLKPIQDILSAVGRPDAVIRVAPTGAAAALIDGMTVHAALKLRVRRRENCTMETFEVEWSPGDRKQLDDLFGAAVLLVLDEFSLASATLLGQLDTALRVAKQNWDEEFGGMSVILSGDLCQYPPVGERAVYIPMSDIRDKTESRMKTPISKLGRLAYLTFDNVIEFKEQHRMRGNPAFGKAVNRLRMRECTQEDVELFNTRVVKSVTRPQGVDLGEDRFRNASVITVDNYTRAAINKEKARALGGDLASYVEIAANDTISAGKSSKAAGIKSMNKGLREIVLNMVQRGFGLDAYPGRLYLYTGIPVIMKHKNISVGLKVTNGAHGRLRKVMYEADKFGHNVASMAYVEFPQSPARLPGLPEHVYPIKPLSSTLAVPITSASSKKTATLSISRKQLPIEAAFAVTGHSAQGKTMSEVISDPTTKNRQSGFYTYVSLSRARNLRSLALLHPISLEHLNRPLTPHLKFELLRLEILAHNTAVRSGDVMGELREVPVPEVEASANTSAPKVVSDQVDSKRKRTRAVEASSSEKRLRTDRSEVSTPHSRNQTLCAPFWGPSWDETDWSCAYDSALCATMACWLSMSPSARELWKLEVREGAALSPEFEHLLTAQNATEFSNQARDNFRNRLAARDNSLGARGPVNAELAAVLQHCVRNDVRTFRLYFDAVATCRTCQKHLGTGEVGLDLIVSAPRNTANFALSEWLHHSFAEATRNAVPMLDECCQNTSFAIQLDEAPAMVCFEVDPRLEVIPEEKISFPTSDDYARYELGAVLYKSGASAAEGHFTAKFVWKGEVFAYDGMTAGGVPQHLGPLLHLSTGLGRGEEAKAVGFMYYRAD